MIEFISGLMTGGLFGILLMCLLQIYRDNEAQRRIDKAIEYINKTLKYKEQLDLDASLITTKYILGGDVDDE